MSGGTPLAGVRVVDITRLLPGAYCTLVLADLGADIVKIEDPGGGDLMRTLPPQVGGLSVYHHALNRNKRSVTLDLRADEGRAVLDRLLAGADIVVESFRPRTARRLNVSAGDLRGRHPRLVHCSITGFGQAGPYAERAAHDLDFVALAGLFEIERDMQVPRLLVADIGGAWAAVAGILAALFQRERTGEGAAVDIAMFDVAASWLTFPAAAATMRPAREAGALPITGDAACYNVYATADGRHLALAAIEQKFWQMFCERIGRPELIPRQFSPEQQPGLREELAATFRTRTAGEWLATFADVDVCLALVNTVGEALADVHLQHRGEVMSVGDARFIRAPVVVHRGAPDEPPGRVPIVTARALGADTDDVLRSAGLTEAELASLHDRRVI